MAEMGGASERDAGETKESKGGPSGVRPNGPILVVPSGRIGGDY